MSEENTPETAEENTPESLLDDSTPELADGEWFLTEGVKGSGDIPEWYQSSRYKSVDEQAKAYNELEKKFGSFKGAPKDGYNVPEQFDAEDELVKEVLKFGEETGLHQDGMDKLLELAMKQAEVTEEVSFENELTKLGDNANSRIKTVETYLKNNLDATQYDEIKDLVSTADSIILVEKLINATAPKKLPIDGGEHPAGLTWADIEKEMFRKDENGNLLRSISREHEQKVQRMMKEYGGDKAHKVVMGG